MRIFTKLIFLFLAFIPLVVQAQTVNIGTSGTTTSVTPVYAFFGYTYSQQIVLQSEINASGNITAIQFQTNAASSSYANSNGWTIYMGSTTQSSFASTTSWIPVSSMTQVFSGTVTYPAAAGWFTINLTTPFPYSNINNLVIAVDENVAGYGSSAGVFKAITTTTARSIAYYDDSINPNPSAPPTANTPYTTLAQMKLEGLSLQGCQAPTSPSVSGINATSANLAWTAAAGGTASTGYDWKVVAAGAGSTGSAVSSGTTTSGAVTASATGLSSSISYDFYVRNNCSGSTNSSWVGPINFATPCSTISLNVTQSFEGGTSIPACWTSTFVSGTKAFSYGTTNSAAGTSPNPSAVTGSNRLLFSSYSGSGSQTRLSTPPIITTGTASVDVGFQWYHSTTGGAGSYLTEGVQVQYSTNGTTWTNAGSLILRYGPTTGWFAKSITLPAAAGNQATLYVGFLFTSNAGYDSYMDDILIKPTPGCLPPSALTVGTITQTGATLSWTPSVSAPTSYDIYYSTASTAPTSTTTPSIPGVVGTSNIIAGLMPSSTYNVWMRSACGGTLGSSDWTATPLIFATSCGILGAINENFDNTVANALPNCWVKVGALGSAYTQAGSSNSGTNCFYIYASGSTSQPTVALPPVSNINTNTHRLRFSARGNFSTGDVLQIGYMIDLSNAGSFVSFQEVTIPSLTYTQFFIDMGTTPVNGSYIAIRHRGNLGNSILIDDLVWEPKPVCSGTPSATAITTSSAITCPGGSVTLTATNAPQAIGLSFVWQESTNAGANWSNITGNPTTTPYVVSNITGNTQYRYYGTCSNSGISTPSNVVSVSTSISVVAVTSTIGVCSGATTTNANLSLSGTVPTGVTYLWQVSTNGGGSYSNAAGSNASPTYSAIVTISSIFRCVINCGGASVNSTPVSVDVTNCNYQAIYLPSGNTYVSIATTGLSAPFWLNPSSLIGDDNITTDLPLGFPFFFKGQTYTTLRACTNGFVSFTPGTTNVVYDNDMTGGPGKMLAPLWDDWVTQGNTAAALATSFKYQASGTAPNRVFTAEWIGMEQFLHAGPNINFQLVLHEGTNAFEYNYGTMEGFNGTVNKGDTYSLGITNTSSDYYALQSSRSNYFATINTINITELPECNSAYAFILSPTNISGAAPAAVIPTNDNPSGAISVPVNTLPCTSYCGTYFSTKNASASSPAPACGGSADDDVWFKFTATTAGAKISILGSFGFNTRVELLDASFNSLQCNATAPGDGLLTTFTNSATTIGSTYYVRVYDDGVGLGTNENGYFSICISEYIPPPVNDECAGAITINAGVSCIPTTGSTLTATESLFITSSCNTPDDDLWYSFTALSTTPTISLQSGSGFNGAMQIFSGTCANLSSIACVNTGSTAVTETYTASNFTVGATYYMRAFHAVLGSATGNFSICVVEPTPPCPLKNAPSTASTNTPLSGNTLTWNSSVGASAYDVYFGTDLSLVSAYDLSTRITPQGGIAGLSFDSPTALEYGTTYYWTVSARNTIGGSPNCSTFSFTTIPLPCPVKNSPLDAATALPIAGNVLSWTAALGASAATSYDVYFGTNQTLVASYDVSAKIAVSNVSTSFSLAALNYATTYYWTISAKNTGVASPSCSVFSFTTEPLLCSNNGGISPTMPTNTENILSQMCSDGGIYTYYGIPATNKYCLAVAWGTNTAAKTYAETNNTITMYKNASGNVIQGSGNTQTATLNSYWNVDLGTNTANYLQTPVSVKFYLDTALYNALTTTISTYGVATPITAFKTVGSQFSYTGSPSDATTGQWIGMTALNSSGLMTDANGASFVELTGITSFSGGSIAVSSTVSSPLPISLKSFTAFEQGKINVVRWETATEKNVRTFLVEKSENGTNWTKLGEILPSASKKYSLNDENPFVTTYYRLKNIDNDTRVDVSNTVVVTRKSGKFTLTNVAPNPTHDNIEVKFETTENQEVTLRILDIFGKEITVQKVDAQNGINAITVDMSSIVPGTYFVNINNGTSSLTKRISKI